MGGLTMTPDRAETLALQALGHVASDPDLGGAFMGANDLTVQDLKAGARDPVFLASVLDFLCQRDDWVIAFCDANGWPYDAPMMARYALPGAQETHWT